MDDVVRGYATLREKIGSTLWVVMLEQPSRQAEVAASTQLRLRMIQKLIKEERLDQKVLTILHKSAVLAELSAACVPH